MIFWKPWSSSLKTALIPNGGLVELLITGQPWFKHQKWAKWLWKDWDHVWYLSVDLCSNWCRGGVAACKQGIKVEGVGTYARWATGAHCGGVAHWPHSKSCRPCLHLWGESQERLTTSHAQFQLHPEPRQGGKGLGLCTLLSTVAYVSVTRSPEQRCAVVWINIELSIPVCGEEKNQNQRTTGFGYFKNLKELVGFSWKNQWKTSGYIGSHLIKLPNF